MKYSQLFHSPCHFPPVRILVTNQNKQKLKSGLEGQGMSFTLSVHGQLLIKRLLLMENLI